MKSFKILFAAILFSMLIASCNNGGEPGEGDDATPPVDTTHVDTTVVSIIDNHQIK